MKRCPYCGTRIDCRKCPNDCDASKKKNYDKDYPKPKYWRDIPTAGS